MFRVDLVGQVFGRLTVNRYAGCDDSSNSRWACTCECGAKKLVYGSDLRTGHTTSCGCWRKENNRTMNITHGRTHTPLYNVWVQMRYRCEKPSNASYEWYGARGITVCDRWLKFENFLADMGERPSHKHTIERTNTDGNYEKANCIWLLSKYQNKNKRNSWQFEGKTQVEWAKELGISQSAVSRRFTTHGSVHLPK